MAPPPETQPDSTSSSVLMGCVNQSDHNLLPDSLGVSTERVNRRIRQGIILQSRQIALFDPRGGLDVGQAQPESLTGGLEDRNRLPQHGMPGLRPPPTGHQFCFLLFDLFTDHSMAHTLLFCESFMDTVNFSLGHFLILYFKGGYGIQSGRVNLFVDHANVATIGRVTKGNWAS